MANEEKIKAFLSDKKKVEAIAQDKEFLEAVSGGKIQTENMVKKFRELGLPLSDNEAIEVKNATEKALAISPEKLENTELQKISGGTNQSVVGKCLIGAGHAGVISAVGCLIAGIVCNEKAFGAYKNCDWDKYKKLNKTANILFATATSCLAVGGGLLTGNKLGDLAIKISEKKEK